MMMMIAIRTNHYKPTITEHTDIFTCINVAIAAVQRAHTGRRQMERSLFDALEWSVLLDEQTADIVFRVPKYAPQHQDDRSSQQLADVLKRGWRQRVLVKVCALIWMQDNEMRRRRRNP